MSGGGGDILRLNVGGKRMITTRRTLVSESHSKLARMFDPDSDLLPVRMADGHYFLDTDPAAFEVLVC